MAAIQGDRKTFYQLLVNTLLVSIVNFTVWFAVTFFVYVETRSVFATGVVSGIFLALTALTGVWFGSLVDHHGKTAMMQVSAAASVLLYTAAFFVYQLGPRETFKDPTSVRLWAMIVLLMVGVIVGNIRTIALPTMVTALIEEGDRDRANGLVGTTSGASILVTSVISGVLVSFGGMFWVFVMALAALTVAVVHMSFVRSVPAAVPAASEPGADEPVGGVDLRGTIRLVGEVPGLGALILFSTFNNFLGGVYLALLDAYGLSLVSVQTWGLLWGALSAGLIVGGLCVARTGLGSKPVRLLLLLNVVAWTVTVVFPLRSSIVLLAIGMMIYMLVVPYAEAAEQTILQKVVPYERQGRVFGFAQSVEQAASPLTAFLVSPVAQFVFIPFMTDGAGARTIGGWFGTGPERGIALVFVIFGLAGLIVSAVALRSRPYRRLSDHYQRTPAPETEKVGEPT
jgi:DHA3 family multidrug efflux protein-like MFS transporter